MYCESKNTLNVVVFRSTTKDDDMDYKTVKEPLALLLYTVDTFIWDVLWSKPNSKAFYNETHLEGTGPGPCIRFPPFSIPLSSLFFYGKQGPSANLHLPSSLLRRNNISCNMLHSSRNCFNILVKKHKQYH